MEKKIKKDIVKKKSKVKVFTKNRKKNAQPENVVIEKLKAQYESIDIEKLAKFVDLPLSSKTIKALKEAKYLKLTDIQKMSIALALQGKDILGAAQTGSGKTLAFLIPVIERLFCEQWSRVDGLGALIITPTRELAYQIFETLRNIGKYHDFSAGLIIGGKDLKFERKRMDQCNVVVCTPGRLLQHMDENPLFDCVNMKVLVLDEADRCLDMGFKETMNAIIANLPAMRQTLLFSATQTKSVKDLARLSLKDPSYVSVNEMTTPKELRQSYAVCELKDKVSILWSFIKDHLKKKTIIFFSTCKQVKFFYEIFSKLRPGLSLLPLYGTLHQLRRMKIYEEFCQKKSAVLFATDLAARGLDFPEVHWVVQADCPEDVETYIHRVGRTARYYKGGESLLMLTPSETKMLEHIEEKKIPIEHIQINYSKLQNPLMKMQSFLSVSDELRETAQRAVSHYARSIFFMKLKDVFNVQELDFDAYSKSLGLSAPPRIRFLNRMNKKQQQTGNDLKFNDVIANNTKKYFKEVDNEVVNDNGETSSDDFKLLNLDVEDDIDIVATSRVDLNVDRPADVQPASLLADKCEVVSKDALVSKMLKKKIQTNQKVIFDVEENVEEDGDGQIDLDKFKLAFKDEDKEDRKLFTKRVSSKHKELKRKLKEKIKKEKEEEEQDEFGSSDEGEGPDLSWLPDPDKLYGEAESDDNQSNVEEELAIEKKKSKKRKQKHEVDVPKSKKQKKIQLTDDFNVNESEELALMLLKGNK